MHSVHHLEYWRYHLLYALNKKHLRFCCRLVVVLAIVFFQSCRLAGEESCLYWDYSHYCYSCKDLFIYCCDFAPSAVTIVKVSCSLETIKYVDIIINGCLKCILKIICRKITCTIQVNAMPSCATSQPRPCHSHLPEVWMR